jgi:citrate lyase beta subunit
MVNCKEILLEGKDRFIAAAFGADDFTADFEVYRSESDIELDFARKYFALHCHAYGITSIDTPYVQYKNPAGLRDQLTYLKTIGMKAKFAIHPTQIDLINEVLNPSAEEIEYYKRMVDAFDHMVETQGKAALQFENKMIDVAAFRRAKNLLIRAKIMKMI